MTYLVVDPNDSFAICYSDAELSEANRHATNGLLVYGLQLPMSKIIHGLHDQNDQLKARIAELEHRCGMYGLELKNEIERRIQATEEAKRLRAELAALREQVPLAYHGEARQCLFVLREIGSMDAEDITGDDVDLRFEDEEGRDTGSGVSIVDYAERAAKVIEAMLYAAPAVAVTLVRGKRRVCHACASHARGEFCSVCDNAPTVVMPDKQAVLSKAVGLASRIPGANDWCVAEFVYEEIAARLNAVQASEDKDNE